MKSKKPDISINAHGKDFEEAMHTPDFPTRGASVFRYLFFLFVHVTNRRLNHRQIVPAKIIPA